MEILIENGWVWFCVTFGVTLFITLIMHQQGRFFYTKDVVERKFSIMDLELPASALELANLINGIYLLPADRSQKALKALRGQLYVDFFFMPAAYGSIFILCYIASGKMTYLGHEVFLTLGWLQIVAWVCDIIENIYLLNKIAPGVVPSKPAVHKAYQSVEAAKIGIALTGAVCSVYVFFYFWLTGNYLNVSLHYLVIIIAEILLFIIGGKLFYEKYKDNPFTAPG